MANFKLPTYVRELGTGKRCIHNQLVSPGMLQRTLEHGPAGSQVLVWREKVEGKATRWNCCRILSESLGQPYLGEGADAGETGRCHW